MSRWRRRRRRRRLPPDAQNRQWHPSPVRMHRPANGRVRGLGPVCRLQDGLQVGQQKGRKGGERTGHGSPARGRLGARQCQWSLQSLDPRSCQPGSAALSGESRRTLRPGHAGVCDAGPQDQAAGARQRMQTACRAASSDEAARARPHELTRTRAIARLVLHQTGGRARG